MRLAKALDKWLRSLGEDDGDSVPERLAAFAAGWHAARPVIKGTSDGHLLHNGDNQPGHLKVTLHGETKDGQPVQLTMTEAAALRLLAGFRNTAIGLDNPQIQAAAIINPKAEGSGG